MDNKSQEKFPFIGNIEESLFKAFLQDRKMWVDFNEHILPDYFNLPEHTKIFKIYVAFFNKYLAFPTLDQMENIITKKSYDEDTLKSTRRIYAMGDLTEKEVKYLYDECAEFIKNNKIKNAILESVELLDQGKFEEIEMNIKSATSWSSDIKLGTDMIMVRERMAALEQVVGACIPSPWPTLNKIIGGGAFEKELTLCASSSSVGKSIWLDNWATYAWKELKKNVLVLTLELSEVRKAQRMDAEMHAIKANDIILRKEEIFKWYDENKLNSKLFIKEFPTNTVNINALKQYAYQLELYTGFKPDVIFVDYLDLLNPTKKTFDDYSDQGRVGSELRGWAVELAIPLISASQLNRKVVNLPIIEISEEHISDSYKKMMVSDTIVVLSNTPEERINGIINQKSIKARNGQKDIHFSCGVDYPTLTIYDRSKKVI